jgi:hypothetical protein
MMDNKRIEVLTYDVGKYNFPKIIGDLINLGDLASLSADFDRENPEVESSLYKNMERTQAYSRMYAALNSDEGKQFCDTFYQFVAEVIRPRYDAAIYFQKKPTHRILFADAPGVSRFHRDRDYGHNPEEINFFVPQTKAFGTNTLWIESQEGKGDFEPVELEPGQFLRFDGANLKHGAKVNASGKTRVSFDFRILPSAFAEEESEAQKDEEGQDLERSLKQNPHNFERAD